MQLVEIVDIGDIVVGRVDGGEGMTILLVEQNAMQALRLASRGYVLERGQVTLSGPTADLLNDPLVQASYLGT